MSDLAGGTMGDNGTFNGCVGGLRGTVAFELFVVGGFAGWDYGDQGDLVGMLFRNLFEPLLSVGFVLVA